MQNLLVVTASVMALTAAFVPPDAVAEATGGAPLALEAKIPLGVVEGRIDHMALDAERGRLFVAELGNDTVAVVSLPDRKVIRVIDNLKEPQGVGYLGSS